jgi:hypothetical protein
MKHTPMIPALGRQTEEDTEFKANLGCIVRPYLRKPNKKKKLKCHTQNCTYGIILITERNYIYMHIII